jgi:hypothetical protein
LHLVTDSLAGSSGRTAVYDVKRVFADDRRRNFWVRWFSTFLRALFPDPLVRGAADSKAAPTSD